jgi:tetratricopeptide (TPR) repeat protein
MSSDFQPMRSAEENEGFEAFDLVTDALMNIDSYQKSEDPKFLTRAEKCLRDALEKDSGYFKAQYLLAMVNYLGGHASDAASQFIELLGTKGDATLDKEIMYNLAAAQNEAGRPEQAISLFKQLILMTKIDDPELNLLARAGLLLTRAERWRARQGYIAERNFRRIKAQSKRIRKRLGANFFMRWLRAEKNVDKMTAVEVEKVIDKALSGGDKPPRGWREFIIRRKRFALITGVVIVALLLAAFILASIVSYYLYRGFHYR